MPSVTHAPTEFEQLMFEMLNRARLDPAGEFAALISDAASGTGVQSNVTSALRYFGVDLTSFQAQLTGIDALAPLAWNDALAEASDTHSELMISFDQQSHNLPGEPGLSARIEAAGYDNWQRVAENVYAYAEDAVYGHAGFFIDWGYDDEDIVDGNLIDAWASTGDGIQDPPGHRNTILNAGLTEVGISAIPESDGGTGVGPNVVTQDFGTRSDYVAQLLGVAIEDGDGDRFYDIGEGLGGLTVTVAGTAGTFSTTTWDAGGYQIEVPAGNYTVTFSGDGLTGEASYAVTMGSENIKLDAYAAEAVAVVNQTLTGDAGDNVLTGASGNDTLTGAAGADQLMGLGGQDVLIGDTFEVGVAPVISRQVYRLYEATLDRMPDSAGHLDWTTRVFTGARTLSEVAEGFVASAEFEATYGSSLSSTQFVELLYQNVLDRAADSGGLATWVGRLDDGTSRADVVLGFSESQEFQNNTNAAATSFTEAATSADWADDVYRLYQATLDRAPDADGFSNWTGQLGTGRAYLDVITGFVGSAEFQTTYGPGLSSTQFVELLYQNVLDRAADTAGLASWVGQLDGGTTRETVVQGFAQSQEFITATTAPLETYMRGLGGGDTLSGGAGDNILVGGAYADEFVFDAASDGANTIWDFEAWDTLNLTGFGYADDAAALAQFSQDGADVVFSDQGVDIMLLDIQLSLLNESQIALV